MKNKYCIASTVFLILICSTPFIVNAETLYAKKTTVKIRHFDNLWADVKATLRKGNSFEIIKRSGNFYEGKTVDGEIGWVFKFDLTRSRPSQERNSEDVLADLGENKPVLVHEATTSSSIRGLTPEEESNSEEVKNDEVELQDDGFFATSPW